MMGNLHISTTKKLDKDAANRILYNKNSCILSDIGPSFRKKINVTCHCGECLIYNAIMHGQIQTKAHKRLILKSLAISSTTQKSFQVIFVLLKGLSASAQILIYVIALSLPFNLINNILVDTRPPPEQYGLDVLTIEQVLQAANNPPPPSFNIAAPRIFKLEQN